MLDECGISFALSWYVQGLAERSSLEIDLKIPENFGRVPSETELLIFRLVQECLTNIHRHSGSKTALIRIDRNENTVHVKVEDQGSGMSPERLAEIQSHGTGVGIRGMRERVRHFHGDLVIESSGFGTKVSVNLPLKTAVLGHPSRAQQDLA
jgi:signal transduction histidine kinase